MRVAKKKENHSKLLSSASSLGHNLDANKRKKKRKEVKKKANESKNHKNPLLATEKKKIIK